MKIYFLVLLLWMTFSLSTMEGPAQDKETIKVFKDAKITKRWQKKNSDGTTHYAEFDNGGNISAKLNALNEVLWVKACYPGGTEKIINKTQYQLIFKEIGIF